MKTISLWQPWASAMAVGLKANETRFWPTNHRGELAIHAAKKKPGDHISYEVAKLIFSHRDRFPGCHGTLEDFLSKLPYGQIVCVVEVFDCVVAETLFPILTDTEITLGNYGIGRFAWQTRNYRRLDHPVPCVGRQGFFNLPPEVELKIREQLT